MPEDENDSGATFLEAMPKSLGSLQHALRAGLTGLGISNPRPASIAKGLQIDKSTAWKVGRITTAEPALKALEYMPGTKGGRSIAASFERAGLEASLAQEIATAFALVDTNMRKFAGDRATAQMLARAQQPEGTLLDMGQRRNHFRTSSSIWGARARLHLKTDFILPGSNPSELFSAGFEGLLDLHRLRPGGRWRIGRKRILRHDELQRSDFEPLEDSDAPGEAPLLRKYCSRPLPRVYSSTDSAGFVNFELDEEQAGMAGPTTCVIGTVCTQAIFNRDEVDRIRLACGVHLRTPVEEVVLDFFVHRSLVPEAAPSCGLYSQLKDGPPFPETGLDQPLQVDPRVELIFPSAGAQVLLGVPSYPSMMQDALELIAKRLDCPTWVPEDFNGYRMRISFPPAPSFATISQEYANAH